MNKRKLLLLASALCIVAILAVGGTLAYFTDTDDATNVFTVGNVDIDLTEPKWEEEGMNEAKEVYPGEPLAKDPTITNQGKNPCFVRINITGWDCFRENNPEAGLITVRTDYVPGKLGDNWVLHTDGWYYYTEVLMPEEVTDALFDQVVVPADLKNGNAADEFELYVLAQAVQAQGAKPSFAAVQEMTVEEIAAWFGTCIATSDIEEFPADQQ